MKPEEVYSYECCPICKNEEFYSCEGYVGGGEADGRVCLAIKPSKFKLITVFGPYFALPYYWAACPSCNYFITKIDTDKLRKFIKDWLKSTPIENTVPSRCLSCGSENCLSWGFSSKNIEEYKIRFNWASSYNFSAFMGKIMRMGPEIDVCFDCGFCSMHSNQESINDFAHKRYLKTWPGHAK